MRTRSRAPAIALVLVVVAPQVAIGCGDDDGASPARDAGPDATTPDAAATPDAARLPDGAADATPARDGGDPGLDAEADARVSPDGSIDANPADASVDAPFLDAGVPACLRTPRPEDAERFVVVSHPYGEGGAPAGAYEVLRLATDGTLSRLGSTFEMGRTTGGRIAMTPDGALGIVAQEDGTLGVFALDPSGAATVVHSAFEGSFYATSVLLDADGQGAWVLSAQWREVGGGLFRIAIGCDGTITELGRVESKLPYALARVPGRDDRLVLAAADVLASPSEMDLHLLADATPPVLLGSIDVFPDEEAIVGALEVTSDGTFALVGDGNAFSGLPNRVGIAELDGDALSGVQVLSPLEDPVAIVASPFDRSAIVVSGFGNAIFVLRWDVDASMPFRIEGELAYEGARPQLPGAAVRIDRGTLRGRVLVSENVGVRSVAFELDGPRDLGLFSFGEGLPAIVGAIGVTP